MRVRQQRGGPYILYRTIGSPYAEYKRAGGTGTREAAGMRLDCTGQGLAGPSQGPAESGMVQRDAGHVPSMGQWHQGWRNGCPSMGGTSGTCNRSSDLDTVT